jgi:hypothetical protein
MEQNMDTTFEYKGRSLRVAARQSDDGWQYQYAINEGDLQLGGVLYPTEEEALEAGGVEARAEVDEERM